MAYGVLERQDMVARLFRSLFIAACFTGSAALGVGCTIEELPPPEYADGYDPQYYDGYIVYYDDVGRPFYYLDGAVVWVPLESPFYVRYVNQWQIHGPEYRRWYIEYGDHYKHYRGRAGHYGGHHH